MTVIFSQYACNVLQFTFVSVFFPGTLYFSVHQRTIIFGISHFCSHGYNVTIRTHTAAILTNIVRVENAWKLVNFFLYFSIRLRFLRFFFTFLLPFHCRLIRLTCAFQFRLYAIWSEIPSGEKRDTAVIRGSLLVLRPPAVVPFPLPPPSNRIPPTHTHTRCVDRNVMLKNIGVFFFVTGHRRRNNAKRTHVCVKGKKEIKKKKKNRYENA